MRNQRLQTQITAGRWTLPAVVSACTICWVIAALVSPDITGKYSGYAWWESIRSFIPYPLLDRLCSFLLYGFIGYLLVGLNNAFAIIRIRASVQTSLYLIFVTACPALHCLHAGEVASAAFVLSLFFLFRSYRESRTTGSLFYSFAFLGTGSLFFPQLVFFTPIWLIGAYMFRALYLQSFCAAVIGYSFPYWFLFGHAFFYDRMELFYAPFRQLSVFYPVGDLSSTPVWLLVTLGYLSVLYVVCTVHCITSGHEDKLQTRAQLFFLIRMMFCTFAFIILQPGYGIQLLPVLFIGISILTGHLFALTRSRASNRFFILSMLCIIGLYIFNLWMLL